MKIRIDETRCTGHGRCYSLAPEVFEPDDQGHGTVIEPDVAVALHDKAKLGVDSCPERAIVIAQA